MNREKRILKPYHGVIAFVCFFIVQWVITPWLQANFELGIFGSLIGELLFLLVAVGSVAAFRGNFKKVFPIHKPKASAVFGTLVLWVATLLGVMVITLVLAYFFPEQVFGTSQSIGSSIFGGPFLLTVFIVSVIPAICEEAMFRGVLLNSLWPLNNKWLVITIVGVIFGICHGSIWRFFPTAILGIAMGYLVVETNNIVYSSLMHFVNNLMPVVLFGLLQGLTKGMGGLTGASNLSASLTRIPLASVGIYLIFASSVPFLVYIANYLIHKGQRGAAQRLFPQEKKRVLYFLIALSAIIFVCGVILMAASVFVDQSWMNQILNR